MRAGLLLIWRPAMKVLLVIICWCILFAISWPLALLALALFPVVWLISLPLRLLFHIVEGCLALVRAILLLPARLFGHR